MTPNAVPTPRHTTEVVAMLALTLVVATVVVSLGAFLDLSGDKMTKITVAYVIMGGMLLDRMLAALR